MKEGKGKNRNPVITTKNGDDGTTGMFLGGRVHKNDERVEAFGAIDEAVSSLGFARSLISDLKIKTIVENLQRDLFIVGAELATLKTNWSQLAETGQIVSESMVLEIEELQESLYACIELPKSFIVPGDSQESAVIDISRTLIRKAERKVIVLYKNNEVENPNLLRYLNRASDLAFVLARYLDKNKPYNKLH